MTQTINRVRGTPGAAIWQGRYYDHIIRDEPSLNLIREYILYNPVRWEEVRLNPANVFET